ncbi:DUF3265 domain-containing protein [Grimontia hollisae]|nr:DUF3265 domain-containing protein [Grimontia hollisae]
MTSCLRVILNAWHVYSVLVYFLLSGCTMPRSSALIKQ